MLLLLTEPLISNAPTPLLAIAPSIRPPLAFTIPLLVSLR
jgi:hypothetical protein